MRDAAATKERVLEAGTAEFARYGIAGARVDRVAANASINESQIYSYFGSRDKRFDAVFDHRVDTDTANISLDAGRRRICGR